MVNESNAEVIGHIVATDELGEAYVIPFTDIFEDIKSTLRAKSVEVASASSIRSVKSVFESLSMVGYPHLDAIRGNGVSVHARDPLQPQLEAIRGNPSPINVPLAFSSVLNAPMFQNNSCYGRKQDSDSGYGSTGSQTQPPQGPQSQSSASGDTGTSAGSADVDQEDFRVSRLDPSDDIWRMMLSFSIPNNARGYMGGGAEGL